MVTAIENSSNSINNIQAGNRGTNFTNLRVSNSALGVFRAACIGLAAGAFGVIKITLTPFLGNLASSMLVGGVLGFAIAIILRNEANESTTPILLAAGMLN